LTETRFLCKNGWYGKIREFTGKGGMSKLTGGDNVTLDDTGRISLPRYLRDMLEKDKVWLGKGSGDCLWLYTPGQWEEMEETILELTNPFDPEDGALLRHYVGSAHPLEIDKQGRIPIKPELREWAGLTKECKVFGQSMYIEIWAADRYQEYEEKSKEELRTGSKKLGARIMEKRKLRNDGVRSYAGSAGRDNTVSGAEGRGGIDG
jgi:MraZ protein